MASAVAVFNRFNVFAQNLAKGVHNLDGSPPTNVLKVMLTDVAPVVTNTVFANITEIAAGNGYTAGGAALVSPTGTLIGLQEVLASNQVVFTASGGAIAQFRYAVLYDSTPTSPLKPLIGWWDYGSEFIVADTANFTITFAGLVTAGTILTLG